MPACRGGITPMRSASPRLQPALCSFLPCLLLRQQAGAGLMGLPCQRRAANLLSQSAIACNSIAYASSAEVNFSSRVLRSVGSRENVMAKLFTLAYRVRKLAVVLFWLTASLRVVFMPSLEFLSRTRARAHPTCIIFSRM